MDPGYAYGVKLAEASGRTMLRLGNADVLPFDFSGMSDALTRYVGEIEGLVQRMRADAERTNAFIDQGLYRLANDPAGPLSLPVRQSDVPRLQMAPLRSALSSLRETAHRFSIARAAFESSGASLISRDLVRLNHLLRTSEQLLAPEVGLPARPWYRHHVYAPGYDTGYGVKTLPSIREAIERRDWDEAASQIEYVAELIRAYESRIDAAASALDAAR